RPAVSTFPAVDFNTSLRSAHLGLSDAGTTYLIPVQIANECHGIGWNVSVGTQWSGSTTGWIAGLAVGKSLREDFALIAEVFGERMGAEEVWILQGGFRKDFS